MPSQSNDSVLWVRAVLEEGWSTRIAPPSTADQKVRFENERAIVVAVALLLAAVGFNLVCAVQLSALNRGHKLPVFTARYAVKSLMRVMAYRGVGAGCAGIGAAVLMDGPWSLELVHRMLFAGLASGTAVLLPALVVSVAHNRAVRAEKIGFP